MFLRDLKKKVPRGSLEGSSSVAPEEPQTLKKLDYVLGVLPSIIFLFKQVKKEALT